MFGRELGQVLQKGTTSKILTNKKNHEELSQHTDIQNYNKDIAILDEKK